MPEVETRSSFYHAKHGSRAALRIVEMLVGLSRFSRDELLDAAEEVIQLDAPAGQPCQLLAQEMHRQHSDGPEDERLAGIWDVLRRSAWTEPLRGAHDTLRDTWGPLWMEPRGAPTAFS